MIGFLLVANSIDVVVLAVVMAPMVSTIGISVTTQAHFQPELLTLPLDRNQFSFQSQTHPLSARKNETNKKKLGKMRKESIEFVTHSFEHKGRHFKQQSSKYQ